MGWGLCTKINHKEYKDAAILFIMTACACVNAVLVYRMITSDLSVALHIVQMAACSCMIPLIKVYFSRHIGQSRTSILTVLLWVLAVLSFVPNVVLSIPLEPQTYSDLQMKPFALYVLSHGQKVYAIYMGDLMVALQAILTVFGIFPFAVWIKSNGLRFNPKIYAFVIWWICAIVAAVVLSGMTYEDLRSTAGEWFYFTVYSLLIVTINIFIALRFDLHPVQTEDGDAVNDLDSYLNEQYQAMAGHMQQIIENEKLHLQPECSAEQMVERLQTNRTYFSRMMTSVHGISFSEYINNLRLDQAKKLLKETKQTVAEIAYHCGYSDSSYMSRKFKEKYSMSPSEWRKQM